MRNPWCALRRRSGERAAQRALRGLLLVLLFAATPVCRAGIDHLVTYDDSGIWKRSNQEMVEYGLIAVEVGGALWEGGETRLGKTFWTSVDSSVAAGIVAQVMKVAFSRVRPRDSGP